MNKHRMNQPLSSFAARLCEKILNLSREGCEGCEVKTASSHPSRSLRDISDRKFSESALELFALQFKCNSAYRKICDARKMTPQTVGHWTQIPAVPTGAFKELELTSLMPAERTAVFYSSGTTGQKPSRHFHCAESLAVYEASLWSWFEQNIVASSKFKIQNSKLLVLTPPPAQVPHSSLVHMFEIVRTKLGGASVPASRSEFYGKLAVDGVWTLDFEETVALLRRSGGSADRRHSQNGEDAALCRAAATPVLILGTAFSFVHLLDYLVEKNMHFELPAGSRVLETGGYKNRSRTLPKAELHALITERLGVPRENILCEYGMSELSSQAYEIKNEKLKMKNLERQFRFPPWARVQIISPETGREVADGETGLIRVHDLANVFSVASVQTEDLAVRRGAGFELIGRAQLAEPRGCSLMTA